MATIKISKTQPRSTSGWRPWGTAKTASQAREMAKYGYDGRNTRIVKVPKERAYHDREYVIYLKE